MVRWLCNEGGVVHRIVFFGKLFYIVGSGDQMVVDCARDGFVLGIYIWGNSSAFTDAFLGSGEMAL